MSYFDGVNFSVLLGKTLISVTQIEDEEILFETTEGDRYRMYHSQNCCEGVYVDDVYGDLVDIIGSPIIQAEENSSFDLPPTRAEGEYGPESETWTFYRIATAKGLVVIRWYGSSNGYYSESVDFDKV